VVQPHELLCPQCDHGIGLAVVVGELDFVDTGSPTLDHRADLAAHQARFGQVFEQGNHRMHFNARHDEPSYS
jgi:hypothetical protein